MVRSKRRIKINAGLFFLPFLALATAGCVASEAPPAYEFQEVTSRHHVTARSTIEWEEGVRYPIFMIHAREDGRQQDLRVESIADRIHFCSSSSLAVVEHYLETGDCTARIRIYQYIWNHNETEFVAGACVRTCSMAELMTSGSITGFNGRHDYFPEEPAPTTAPAPPKEAVEGAPMEPAPVESEPSPETAFKVTSIDISAPSETVTVGDTISLPFEVQTEGLGEYDVSVNTSFPASVHESQLTLVIDSFEPTPVTIYAGHKNATIVVDAWNKPHDFGSPEGKDMRPGLTMGGCSANFMFHYQYERYFFGTASHCLNHEPAVGEPDETGNCDSKPYPRSRPVKFNFAQGQPAGSIAYNSLEVMQALDYNYESHADACFLNDFGLVEFGPEYFNQMHPSMMGFGGPVALADSSTFASADEVRGYGSSDLRYGVYGQLHDNAATKTINQKIGTLMWENGDFGWDLYSLPQSIPGDSGGPMQTITGEAWGVTSFLSYVGGYNSYASLDRVLAFMEEHEGWAPELVTSNDFNPNPSIP